MKFKITSANFGHLGLLVFILFVIGGIILEHINPPEEPPIVILDRAFPCQQDKNLWVLSESFKADQSIYICGNIKSNKTTLKAQVQIRVYENKLQPMDNAIYYDNIWISNGDVKLPIKAQFEAGKYVVEISSGRKSLSIIEFDVINK